MKIEIYKDKKKEWRWRMKAANGRIVACSGEGYKRKHDLRKMLDKIFFDMSITVSIIGI